MFSTAQLPSGLRYTRDVIVELPHQPGARPSFERFIPAQTAPAVDLNSDAIATLGAC